MIGDRSKLFYIVTTDEVLVVFDTVMISCGVSLVVPTISALVVSTAGVFVVPTADALVVPTVDVFVVPTTGA